MIFFHSLQIIFHDKFCKTFLVLHFLFGIAGEFFKFRVCQGYRGILLNDYCRGAGSFKDSPILIFGLPMMEPLAGGALQNKSPSGLIMPMLA